MRNLLSLLLVCTTLGGSLSAQVTAVFHEVFAVDLAGPGLTTYRIFANLQDSDDFLSSVYAAGNDYLLLGGTGDIIVNNSSGATVGDALATSFCMFVPELCFDSFVTVGWFGSTDYQCNPIGCGQATTTVSSSPNNTVIADSFGTNVAAPNLEMQDGAWFTTNLTGCNDNGFGIGPTNRVFIAQVTIPSTDDIVYTLNIQIFNGGDGSDPILTVGTCNTVDANEFDGSTIGLQYPLDLGCQLWSWGCTSTTACNYDPVAIQNDGSCEFETCSGCQDTLACNYDDEATIDSGDCEYGSCPGCMDTTACNFDQWALTDDATCEYESCLGCTDNLACNYDSIATIDNDSCAYEGCTGCTDGDACNYDSTATVDDNSCDYTCLGCTDMDADNYDPLATVDDGTCNYSCLGCMDTEACNFDATASLNDNSCDYSCFGCSDSLACNFGPDVSIDDGSCEFESCAGCMDIEACNFDSTATIADSSCEFESCAGCMDMEACNFDSTATIADNSCEFESCAGCTDSTALNFDSTALIEDGSCFFDCEFPSFEFSVYCEESDEENFYVEVTVSGTSNGFPFTVSNDVNASEENVPATGVYNLGAFANNSNLTFTVAADEIDCTMTSDLLTDSCFFISVQEIDLAPLAIFPNPNNGDFAITHSWNDQQITVEILNALGQKVFTQRRSANSHGNFKVSARDQLAEGNYIVRIVHGQEIQVLRFQIQQDN